MSALILAAAVIALRADAPTLSPASAQAMVPARLADAVLAPGHPPVDEAAIGPDGMEAPPAPGRPVETRVRLWTVATSSADHPGFCERTRINLFLQEQGVAADPQTDAARPERLTTQSLYRWRRPGTSGCTGKGPEYFAPFAGDPAITFDTVRRLAALQVQARKDGRLPIPASIVDREGPATLQMMKEDPNWKPVRPAVVYSDPRRALAAMPLDHVSYAGPSGNAVTDIFEPGDLVGPDGRALEGRVVFAFDWTAGLVLDHGRVVRLRLLREIPAPF